MIARVVIAAVGAIVITAGLLLTMDHLISLFRDESGERFFRITDVLPKPDPGRPQRPAPASRQPALESQRLSNPDTVLTIEAPAISTETPILLGPAISQPDLEGEN